MRFSPPFSSPAPPPPFVRPGFCHPPFPPLLPPPAPSPGCLPPGGKHGKGGVVVLLPRPALSRPPLPARHPRGLSASPAPPLRPGPGGGLGGGAVSLRFPSPSPASPLPFPALVFARPLLPTRPLPRRRLAPAFRPLPPGAVRGTGRFRGASPATLSFLRPLLPACVPCARVAPLPHPEAPVPAVRPGGAALARVGRPAPGPH